MSVYYNYYFQSTFNCCLWLVSIVLKSEAFSSIYFSLGGLFSLFFFSRGLFSWRLFSSGSFLLGSSFSYTPSKLLNVNCFKTHSKNFITIAFNLLYADECVDQEQKSNEKKEKQNESLLRCLCNFRIYNKLEEGKNDKQPIRKWKYLSKRPVLM